MALATVTGWPLADIEAFAPALELAYPASYPQPPVYDALRTLEACRRTVTAGGPVLATPSTTLAAAIEHANVTHRGQRHRLSRARFYITIGAEILQVTAVGGTTTPPGP